MQDLELYIHIPFCKKKCLYCDFFSGPFSEDEKRIYFENLIQEIKESPYSDRGFSVSSVFFGGGTPSSVRPEYLEQVLSELRKRFLIRSDAEISMECNPGAVAGDLRKYRAMGINRLSIGLQAVQNDLLKRLGRIHTYEEFLTTYEEARRAGFDNINIDLMSGLPGQNVAEWENGLETVAKLNPEHISAYSLIIAENTPFYALYGAEEEAREKGRDCSDCTGDCEKACQDNNGDAREHDDVAKEYAGDARESDAQSRERTGCENQMKPHKNSPTYHLPSEEEDRLMYERTEEILLQYGYHRYEISNYAKEGKECRHNIGYWNHTPYLGFGAAAASFIPANLTEEPCDFASKNANDKESAEENISSEEMRFLRFKNPEKLDYIEGPYEEQEILEKDDLMGEYMMLGFRMTEGISVKEFERKFGKNPLLIFEKQIQKLTKEGLLEVVDKSATEDSKDSNDEHIRLTKRGLDLANLVFEEFI